ncbi:inorganic diphosphatase [Ehrlichia minasensis]|uniref:Inorganic pyrophosphatase n=1 Tax=Ehrlichia minasensis TaxID=1242993 RepID=A0A4Q6I8V3_9RICK|nr:inorganic diphosphatase [Ehrlichia minasensis]RZB12427.1 inorganic diphosphatase [Ehrlichia minasensis]CEI84916.1 Inorganic pyrophosphatase (Pyrophosp hate phospho-hydrolase) [Ehrlichia minasensis]
MNLDNLTSGDNVPKEINVVIEISQNSCPVKYEFDKKKNLFCVDRFLPTSMYYPCNYGFIPHTCAGDGDPVDVLVATRFPVMSGAVICARPVGVLIMRDEGGEDVKILAVPTSKIDQYYANIKNYSDFPVSFLNSIAHFFSFYKKLEEDKFVSVDGWKDMKVAEDFILNALAK